MSPFCFSVTSHFDCFCINYAKSWFWSPCLFNKYLLTANRVDTWWTNKVLALMELMFQWNTGGENRWTYNGAVSFSSKDIGRNPLTLGKVNRIISMGKGTAGIFWKPGKNSSKQKFPFKMCVPGLPWWRSGQASTLPMQGARVRSLVRELDPASMPQLRVCTPQLRSPRAATKEPACHN